MFVSPKKIDRYFEGKVISAADLNAIISRLERLEKLTGDEQIVVSGGPEGTRLSISKYIPLIRRFRLYEDLLVGETADARIVYRNKYDALVPTTSSGPDFKVIDSFGQFFGFTGDYGWCKNISDSIEPWEIISIAHIARFIKFRLIGSLTRFTESASASVVHYYDGYIPPGNVDVYNLEWRANDIYEFSGGSNSIGLAIYNDVKRRYEVWQIQCSDPVESSASL